VALRNANRLPKGKAEGVSAAGGERKGLMKDRHQGQSFPIIIGKEGRKKGKKRIIPTRWKGS